MKAWEKQVQEMRDLAGTLAPFAATDPIVARTVKALQGGAKQIERVQRRSKLRLIRARIAEGREVGPAAIAEYERSYARTARQGM